VLDHSWVGEPQRGVPIRMISACFGYQPVLLFPLPAFLAGRFELEGGSLEHDLVRSDALDPPGWKQKVDLRANVKLLQRVFDESAPEDKPGAALVFEAHVGDLPIRTLSASTTLFVLSSVKLRSGSCTWSSIPAEEVRMWLGRPVGSSVRLRAGDGHEVILWRLIEAADYGLALLTKTVASDAERQWQ